jgi:hypothetical protein
MGLLSTVMPPAVAAAILVVPSFVTNAWQLLAGPAVTRLLRRLWPMMLGIVLGTVGGAALLVRVDPRWSGLALGLALVLYAAYALVSPALSVPSRVQPWLSPIVGLLTGAITGATGVFVMPAVPYLQALQLDRDELVQALGLSFTVSTSRWPAACWRTTRSGSINWACRRWPSFRPSLGCGWARSCASGSVPGGSGRSSWRSCCCWGWNWRHGRSSDEGLVSATKGRVATRVERALQTGLRRSTADREWRMGAASGH